MVTQHMRQLLQRSYFAIVFLLVMKANPAFALLSQTGNDLNVLADDLKFRLEQDSTLKQQVTPLLVSTPLHYWQESRDDFAANVFQILREIFTEQNALIPCPDCDAWRLHVTDKNSLTIHNGELSAGEIAFIQNNAKYREAKAVVQIQETATGVLTKIVSLKDNRLLYYKLADATQSLDQTRPWDHLAQARDRALREESLAYVFFHLGLYPKAIAQFEFDEQWGNRNQHISGITLSLLEPTMSIGANYHYLFPGNRRFHISGSLLYPLQNAFESVSKDNATKVFVAQAMAQYSFANSYAVFLSLNTQGTISLGFSFYNPLFMPFLL